MNTLTARTKTRTAAALCVAAALCAALLQRWNAQRAYDICNILSAAGLLLLAFLSRRGSLRALREPSVILLGLWSALSFLPLTFRYWGKRPALLLLLASAVVFWLLFACWKQGLSRLAASLRARRAAGDAPAAAVLNRQCLLVFLFSLALTCLIWSWHFPYGKSADVMNQLRQIHGELRFSDIHAVGHTLLLKGLLSLVDDPTIVVVLQIVCICLLYTAFARFFLKRDLPLWAVLTAVGLFNLSVIYLLPAVFPWKDCPYALCVGVLTLLLMRDCEDPAQGDGWGQSVGYGLALAGILLFRLNGVVIVLAVGAYLAVRRLRRGKWSRLAVILLIVLGLWFFVRWLAYDVFGAISPANGFAYQVFGSGIAAAINDGRATPQELARVGEVLPLDWLQRHYDRWDTYTLVWDIDGTIQDPDLQVFNNAFVLAMGAKPGEVLRLYLELLPNHWLTYIKNIAYGTVTLWGHSAFSDVYVYDNCSMLALLFLTASVCWKRREWKSRWIVLAPVLCNLISIAISTVTNENRYWYPTVLCLPFLLLYCFLTQPDSAYAGE